MPYQLRSHAQTLTARPACTAPAPPARGKGDWLGVALGFMRLFSSRVQIPKRTKPNTGSPVCRLAGDAKPKPKPSRTPNTSPARTAPSPLAGEGWGEGAAVQPVTPRARAKPPRRTRPNGRGADCRRCRIMARLFWCRSEAGFCPAAPESCGRPLSPNTNACFNGPGGLARGLH